MRIVLIGSGELACPTLHRLNESERDSLALVVAQPDRPKGRRRLLSPCALKKSAVEMGLEVMTPESINAAQSVEQIKAYRPDLFIVAAYGQFLGERLLGIPARGAINIHPSLLPKYRGAAPIQWALINGDKSTGVTILHVSRKMDAGDIILQERSRIFPDDTAGTLQPRLARQGADMAVRVLDEFRAGTVEARPQDEGSVVFAPKLEKNDGRIDFTRPAVEIVNRIRGLNPWPCCFYERNDGSRLRLLRGRAEDGDGLPGIVLGIGMDGPLVATGMGAVRLLEVQPPGKRVMTGRDYCNGHQMSAGDKLG